MNRLRYIFLTIIITALLLTGCGARQGNKVDMGHYSQGNAQTNTQQAGTISVEEIEEKMSKDDDIYVVISKDESERTIKLGYIGSNKIIQRGYGDMTDFFDRYGSYTTASKMLPGTVVTVGELDAAGKLTKVAVSDEAWHQDDVAKYTLDTEIGMLTIGSSKYIVDEFTRIFSSGNEIRLEQIEEEDLITVQGMDKKILSIVVTRGHGTIALTNTEIFEGGWLSLGTKIYTVVEPNMTMVVPEGKYELSVANDGWGDTKNIKVKRGKITVVDLNDYMGEGPSMCDITFEVFIEDAKLYIDNEEVDYSAPVRLKYGVHDLVVVATGYEIWEQKLAVGSEKATIQIGEKDLKSDKTDTTSGGAVATTGAAVNNQGNTQNNQPTNNNNSNNNTNNTGDNNNNGSHASYLDTLNNLLDSLTNGLSN